MSVLWGGFRAGLPSLPVASFALGARLCGGCSGLVRHPIFGSFLGWGSRFGSARSGGPRVHSHVPFVGLTRLRSSIPRWAFHPRRSRARSRISAGEAGPRTCKPHKTLIKYYISFVYVYTSYQRSYASLIACNLSSGQDSGPISPSKRVALTPNHTERVLAPDIYVTPLLEDAARRRVHGVWLINQMI